jgi:uncharacterized membrane protein
VTWLTLQGKGLSANGTPSPRHGFADAAACLCCPGVAWASLRSNLGPSRSIRVVMVTATHGTRRWYSPRSIVRSMALRPRLYCSALVGLTAMVLLPRSWSTNVREAVAWDLSAAMYLSLAFRIMVTCTSEVIRTRAARQDDSRTVILVIILLAIVASFISIAGLLAEAKDATHHLKMLRLGLAAATIILAWTITQVVFTLHYAHEFYRPSAGHHVFAEGLEFRGDTTPDYWDFFYFATSIGAASQTSDVSIRTKTLRRLVTLHAIISFFFNTAVLALTINLAASMI